MDNVWCMHGIAAPAYWLIRRLTGYRVYHLLALVLVVAAALGALAIPFWQLAEWADGVAGFVGFAIVSLAYLYAAMLVLLASTIIAGGLVVRRIRQLSSAGWRMRQPY
jgi:hypothetical protein